MAERSRFWSNGADRHGPALEGPASLISGFVTSSDHRGFPFPKLFTPAVQDEILRNSQQAIKWPAPPEIETGQLTC
jgi:hypothetical protein